MRGEASKTDLFAEGDPHRLLCINLAFAAVLLADERPSPSFPQLC
jgi:hypothetical protein